jgi:hypothetical protein
MKVAVLNYSGNVGKTTVAKHLLMPRIGDCTWLPVESINEGGDAALNFKGREFKEVLTEVATRDNVVVDIGSSNIEQVFLQLRKLGEAHEDFDFFVIPTVPAEKQQADTLAIVKDMVAMDIDPSRIKVVFNQVPDDTDVQKTFGHLMRTLEAAGLSPSPAATIHESEIFSMLEKDQSIDDAIDEGRDFRLELVQASGNPDKQRSIATQRLASRMAKGVRKELDEVYAALFA